LSHGAREAVLMSKFNPFEFVQEVRQEVSKVTWPTWKEVWITTLMVLVMVSLASVFFLITDQALGYLVNMVLGLRG
jgi:preprotein translocase subunit SecE